SWLHRYNGDIVVESFLPTVKTSFNNVHQPAEEYYRAQKRLLVNEADEGCLCIILDLISDKHRKIGYVDITGASLFLATRKQLVIFGLEYYFDNKKNDVYI
ncbi:unnamed protein product, partial [Adineta steineri]